MKKLSEKDKILHDQFSKYGKNAKQWMNKCILMLPKIEKNRIWEKKGFSGIYEYAAKLAGISRNKVNEGLRILKKTENLPELQKVIQKKGIWAVRPVIRVATPKNQKFWAEKAKTMSQHTLITYVRDIKNSGEYGCEKIGDKCECHAHRIDTVKNDGVALGKPNNFQKIEIKVKPKTAKRLLKIKGKEDWETLMREFLEYKEEKERQFQEELEVEKPEKVQTTSHHVPAKIQKYVKARAKNRCEAPNCTKPGKHLHHTTPFALKKEHDPDKIRLLCEEHHSIAHYGLIQNEEQQPQNWKVQKFPDLTDFKSVINRRVAEFRRGAG